jgi:hypothetical protein
MITKTYKKRVSREAHRIHEGRGRKSVKKGIGGWRRYGDRRS